MPKHKKTTPPKSGLAPGWTEADVVELTEIADALTETRRVQEEMYARFHALMERTKEAAKAVKPNDPPKLKAPPTSASHPKPPPGSGRGVLISIAEDGTATSEPFGGFDPNRVVWLPILDEILKKHCGSQWTEFRQLLFETPIKPPKRKRREP